MAASDESNYSSNEDNNSNFAAKTQGRLLQLKKGRDERMNAIVQESATETDKLRTSIARFQQDRRTEEVRAVAISVSRIIETVERRKGIEQQMETLVSRLMNKTQEVESMMKIGLRGREDDMKKTK
ncbi:t-complex 1 [Fusarium denticulatum]|uniref:T-complex 1 n=1 Tax=Fusarium denticulatum TaxID=48507 RepID=A0A8H5X5G2_9HYPO|nr:t-complex 1 [Fusarium denticulatum]